MNFVCVTAVALIVQWGMNFISTRISYSCGRIYDLLALLTNALAWDLTFWHRGWSLTFVVLALAETILVSSSFVDFAYQEIPNSYNVALALLGGAFIFMYKDFYKELILGGFTAFMIFMLLMVITGQVGGGDVKLSGAVGLFLGISLIPKFCFYSFVSGAIVAVILLVLRRKKAKDVFSFGPYLALSSIYLFIFVV